MSWRRSIKQDQDCNDSHLNNGQRLKAGRLGQAGQQSLQLLGGERGKLQAQAGGLVLVLDQGTMNTF